MAAVLNGSLARKGTNLKCTPSQRTGAGDQGRVRGRVGSVDMPAFSGRACLKEKPIVVFLGEGEANGHGRYRKAWQAPWFLH